MPESINAYLEALRTALDGADPALVQDALWDAENHLRTELAAHRWNYPEVPEETALAKILEKFGSPAEVAAAYRDRESLVLAALRPVPLQSRRADRPAPPPDPEAPLPPWPGLLDVLRHTKAYTSLLYLLLSMVTGIFYFAWTINGFLLSVSLLILIVGIPISIAFLGSVRGLALVEGRLVEALLDVRMPRRPALLPAGSTWGERLRNLVKDRHTWSSLVYFILHMPLGVFFFALMVIPLSLSLSLMAAPLAHWLLGRTLTFTGDFELVAFMKDVGPHAEGWLLVLLALGGFFLLVGTLHLALALGRFQGWMAKQMLVRR